MNYLWEKGVFEIYIPVKRLPLSTSLAFRLKELPAPYIGTQKLTVLPLAREKCTEKSRIICPDVMYAEADAPDSLDRMTLLVTFPHYLNFD